MASSLRYFHLLPLVLLVMAGLFIGSAPARAETFRITARATPTRVVYGTDNHVAIHVSVTDSLNVPAPDGTQVYFYTTLGSLPPIAYTRMGEVDVLLENNAGAGRAFITVTVGGTRQTIRVDYLGKNGEVPATPARTGYRLTANQVYYSVDKRIFDLRDKATFHTAAFTITADSLQFDVKQEILRAQDHVVITAGGATLTGEKCQIEVSAQRGTLVQTEPDYRFVSFPIPALVAKDDEAARNTSLYTPLDPKPTSTWIVCHRATVFPGEQIQFRAPQFYLENLNRRLFSLPYHVINLRSSDAGTFFNSKITLTSDAGVDVDFPVYYAATDHNVGSLHLREVGPGSAFYRGSTGLQLGLEEEYLLGNEADGGLYLDDLTRDTRSVAWNHSHDFGKTHLQLNASYDRYSLDTPYTSRLDFGLSRPVGNTNLNLSTTWSAFQESEDGNAEFSASLPTLNLGKSGLTLGFSPYLGYTRNVIAATSTDPKTINGAFYQGLVTGLGFPVFRMLGGVISVNSTDEIVHRDDAVMTNYFDTTVGYRRRLNTSFMMGLNYSYGNITAGASTTSARMSQRVSFNITGTRANRWDLFAYTSYDLERQNFYSSGGMTYLFPTKQHDANSADWFLRYRGSLANEQDVLSGDQLSSDHLFSIGRNVGIYTLMLHYSPTGNTGVTGIGTGTGKMWAIELARQGF